MNSLRQKAFSTPVYATDGVNLVLTEPSDKAFIGFIRNKMSCEKEVSFDNEVLKFFCLLSKARKVQLV